MSWEIILLSIVMLYLTNKLFDLKNLLNPFVFFYLYQTAFCFIALSYCDTRFPRIPIDPDLKFFIISSYITTFFGALISRYTFSLMGGKYIRINELIVKNKLSKPFQLSGLVVFFLGVIFFLIFTYKTGGVIIFADDIENDRITRKAGAGLYNLLFLAFLLYGYAIILFMKDKTRIVKTILFLFTAFALISYGSRAPLLKLLVATFIIVTILRQKKLSLNKYFKIGLIIFILLVVFGAIRSNFQDDRVSFLSLVGFRSAWRPFVNIQNLQKIFEFFPDKNNFLYGYSYLIDFKLFFPGSNPNFGTYLKSLMDWDFDGGSVTTTFIGLGYLNFGKSAFFIYPFIYGFFFNSVYQLIAKRSQIKITNFLFLLFFSIGVSGSVSTGLFGTFINNILFLFFAILTHVVIKQLFYIKQSLFKLE